MIIYIIEIQSMKNMIILLLTLKIRILIINNKFMFKCDVIRSDRYLEVNLNHYDKIIFSPGPLIFKLREGLKNYKTQDFLLLTGDPAIIGVACSIVSDITNGKYKLLKWDKQERKYYPIEINLHEKGQIDE